MGESTLSHHRITCHLNTLIDVLLLFMQGHILCWSDRLECYRCIVFLLQMTDTITYCRQLLCWRERCSCAILLCHSPVFPFVDVLCFSQAYPAPFHSPEVLLNQAAQNNLSYCGWIQLPGVKGLIVVALIAFQEQQFDILLTFHLTKVKYCVVSDMMYSCTVKPALSTYHHALTSNW